MSLGTDVLCRDQKNTLIYEGVRSIAYLTLYSIRKLMSRAMGMWEEQDLPSSASRIERWTKTVGRVDCDTARGIVRFIRIAIGSLACPTMMVSTSLMDVSEHFYLPAHRPSRGHCAI